jgi:hypothetical protein
MEDSGRRRVIFLSRKDNLSSPKKVGENYKINREEVVRNFVKDSLALIDFFNSDFKTPLGRRRKFLDARRESSDRIAKTA